MLMIRILRQSLIFTYDHRTLKIELPVRSAVLKQCTGGLVVRWVTTGEYPLLYVFDFVFFLRERGRSRADGYSVLVSLAFSLLSRDAVKRRRLAEAQHRQ
jgi:hypothetical protein